MTLVARDPDFEARVRSSFAMQHFMTTLGARLERVELGEVEIALSFRDDLTQQNGFLHAGVGVSVIDSACGYAALTVMEPGRNVLSVEFKVNMLAPAKGASFSATGRVVRSGRNLVVVSGELRADGTLVMLMQGTMAAA
jgi:uncharacterized protein (TIGR00369 family)